MLNKFKFLKIVLRIRFNKKRNELSMYMGVYVFNQL